MHRGASATLECGGTRDTVLVEAVFKDARPTCSQETRGGRIRLSF